MNIFCVNTFHMLSYISLLEKDELDIALTVIHTAIYLQTVQARGPTPLLE